MKLPAHVPKTLQPTLEEEVKLESVILLHSALVPKPVSNIAKGLQRKFLTSCP